LCLWKGGPGGKSFKGGREGGREGRREMLLAIVVGTVVLVPVEGWRVGPVEGWTWG